MGYYYAREVDKCPRDDTRLAVIKEGMGYYYAREVDNKQLHDSLKTA